MSANVVVENGAAVADGVEVDGKVYTLKDIDRAFRDSLRFYIAQRSQAEAEEKRLKAIASAVFAHYGIDHVNFDDGSIKVSNVEMPYFDQAAFKRENPDLAARYSSKRTQTRITVR